MKIFIFLLFILTNLISQELMEVDIKADNFESNQKKNIVKFMGNVKFTKGEDRLSSDKLDVFTKQDDSNQTVVKKYIASGDVNMKLKKPTTILIAKGDKITYDVDKAIYIIEGNGYLEDTNESKIVKGEKIFIDQMTNNIKIDGKSDKPVEFKFKMGKQEK